MIAHEELMRLAIEKAREGIARGQSPFGCAIAVGDDVIAIAHNTVLQTVDITAHAEIVALRETCRRLGNIFVEQAAVACTCEPCPMCMTALHWARVEAVSFGATIDAAGRAGFNELSLPAAEVCRLGRSNIRLIPGVLADECRQLLNEWRSRPESRAY